MKTPVVLKNTPGEWLLTLVPAVASVLLMMALMKVSGRPWSIYSFNKATALTAVSMVLAAITLGSLYRTTTWAWSVRYRRPCGILAAILILNHVYFSFFALAKRYDWNYYARNWESLLYGVLALILFLLLWLTSYSFAHRRMGAAAWKRLQNSTYVLLVLALLHFCHSGKPVCWLAWLEHRPSEECTRSGPLPPLSLILFLGMILVVTVRLLEPLFRRNAQEDAPEDVP